MVMAAGAVDARTARVRGARWAGAAVADTTPSANKANPIRGMGKLLHEKADGGLNDVKILHLGTMATLAEPKRKISVEEAREVAEAAREEQWEAPSFVRELFLGNLRMDLIHPYPEQDPDEIARAKPFLD